MKDDNPGIWFFIGLAVATLVATFTPDAVKNVNINYINQTVRQCPSSTALSVTVLGDPFTFSDQVSVEVTCKNGNTITLDHEPHYNGVKA